MIPSQEAEDIQHAVDEVEKKVLKPYFDQGYVLIGFRSVEGKPNQSLITSRIEGSIQAVFQAHKVLENELHHEMKEVASNLPVKY